MSAVVAAQGRCPTRSCSKAVFSTNQPARGVSSHLKALPAPTSLRVGSSTSLLYCKSPSKPRGRTPLSTPSEYLTFPDFPDTAGRNSGFLWSRQQHRHTFKMAQNTQESQRPSHSRSSHSSTDSSGFLHLEFPTSGRETSHQTGIKMAGTHTFPGELPDWSNLKVIHKNTLPPRASFFLYDTPANALTRDLSKSKTLSLSGTWKFSVANSPFDAPERFQDPKFDASKWGDIQVPGMWQMQGYGKGPQ